MGIDNRPNEASELLGTVDLSDISATAAEMEKFGVHLEDDAHTSGDPGVPVLFRRLATLADRAASSGSNGDYDLPQAFDGCVGTFLYMTNPAGSNLIIDTQGVRESLPSEAHLHDGVMVTNDPASLGWLYVGTSTVSLTVYIYKLAPGETTPRPIRGTNQALVYADAAVSGTKYSIHTA